MGAQANPIRTTDGIPLLEPSIPLAHQMFMEKNKACLTGQGTCILCYNRFATNIAETGRE